MIGIRKDNPNSELPKPGEYGIGPDGAWFGMTPNGHLANLGSHAVEQNPDGAITVTPSIMVKGHAGIELWHGFLTKGKWEPCGHYWEETE